jgi:hypothetical protein
MSRRRAPSRQPGEVWLPLRRVAELEPLTPQREAALRARGADDATIAEIANAELWKNNLYVVTVTRHALGFVTELSIRRVDRTHITDWRHKQRIKNEIAGEEVEAMELYPAMSRLMDTANQAYLWCLPPGVQFPLGYTLPTNLVDADEAAQVGAVQRPLPTDWKQ